MFPRLPYFHLLSCIIQIKELRRPGIWLIYVSTSFVLILYGSCVGEKLEMRSTLLGYKYLVFILFAAALFGESAAHYV